MASVDICNLALIGLGQTTITALTDSNENARRCSAVYAQVRNKLLIKHPWNFAIKRDTLVDMTRTAQDDWVTATDYAIDDIVYDPTLTKYYKCLIAHTSTTLFATDLSSANWGLYTTWITGTVYSEGDKVYNSGIEYACLVNHTAGTFATDLTAVKWVATVSPEYEYTYAFYVPSDCLRILSSEDDYEYQIEGGVLYTEESSINIKYIAEITDTDLFSTEFIDALVAELKSVLALSITNSRAITADVKAEAKELKMEDFSIDAQAGGTPEDPICDDWTNAR